MLSKTNLILTVLLLLVVSTLMATTTPNSSTALQKMNQMPLTFTKNVGQWDERVLFRANSGGATMWFTKEGVTYQFTRRIDKNETVSALGVAQLPSALSGLDSRLRGDDMDRDSVEQSVLTAKFVGANPNPEAIGEGLMDYKCNYSFGNDPSRWRTEVPNYEAITLKGIYDGIDLEYSSTADGTMRYDFIIAPGADAAQIKVAYDGSVEISVDSNGKMIARTKWGTMIEAFGQDNSLSGTAAPQFVLSSDNTVDLAVDSQYRDQPKSLTVGVSFSTYLGGASTDWPSAIAVDKQGNVYVTSTTYSTNYPVVSAFNNTLNGGSDITVSKFLPDGSSLVYSTYIGGSGDDNATSIVVDSLGSAYVTGMTSSSNFPTVNAYHATNYGGQDVVALKLAPRGNALAFSTYLGGSSEDNAYGIGIDRLGRVCVGGFTASTNFPTFNSYDNSYNGGTYDGFVTKFTADGTALVYSTFLGGSGSTDRIEGLAVDTAGCAYVTGLTNSSNFPVTHGYDTTFNGSNDVFLTKFSPSGTSLEYSTFIGGVGDDHGEGLAIGTDNSVYVTGFTAASDFPTVNAYDNSFNGGNDAFVSKISLGGDSLLYSTYLGGSGADLAYGIVVDGLGRATITGFTGSGNYPIANAFDGTYNGGTYDVFVSILSPTGTNLLCSSYLGGSGTDAGEALAIDAAGDLYLTGYTWSSNFPTTNPYQLYQGSQDGFVVKLTSGHPDLAMTQITNPSQATASDSITVEYSVSNIGTKDALDAWVDRIYRDADSLPGGEVLLATVNHAGGLATGATYTDSAKALLPEGSEGNWWIIVVTDALDQVSEFGSESNNRAVSTQPLQIHPYPRPDLVLTQVSVPTQATAGFPVTVDWQVTNLGIIDAVGNWTDRVYLSADSAVGSDTILLSRDYSGTLQPGANYSATQSTILPANLSGDYWLIVQTDADNAITELAPASNNFAISATRIHIKPFPYPDLIVDSVRVATSAFAGSDAEVRWFVGNRGTGGTNSAGWVDKIYFSALPDFDPSNVQLVGTIANTAYLDVNEAYPAKTTIKLPKDQIGDHFFFVVTDADNRVSELNENNNRGRSAVMVVQIPPLPDMKMDSLFAPSSALPGQEIILNWIDRNTGTGDATNTWADGFFLSSDRQLSPDDRFIGSRQRLSAVPGSTQDDFPTSLSAGALYRAQVNLHLPVDLYGFYYIIGRIDYTDAIFEFTGESNNTAVSDSIDITLAGYPDLVVTTVSSASSANSGQSVTISYTVANQGTGSTYNDQAVWSDRAYLSPTATLDKTTAKALGTFVGSSGAFAPGETYSKSQSATIPNGLAGVWYLFVETDVYNVKWEYLFDSNNVVITPQPITITLSPYPDLVVTAVSTPSNVIAGDSLKVDWTVTNNGIAPVDSTTWQDRIFIGPDPTYNPSNLTLLTSANLSQKLPAGSSYSRSTKVLVPPFLKGTQYLYILIDATNAIFEHTGESNDTVRSNAVTVAEYPHGDLAVVSATAPSGGFSGQEITLNFDVKNIAGRTTLATNWQDGVYFSNDNIVGNADDTLLADISRSGDLTPGQSYSRNIKVRLPYAVSGSKYLYVRADNYDAAQEPNEANNFSALMPIAVTLSLAPDLAVTQVIPMTEFLAGQPAVLSWVVKNVGLGATQKSWYDAIYLSPDETLSISDLKLATFQRDGALVPSAEYSRQDTVELPNYLSGPYYLLVKTDAQDQLFEDGSEANNIASVQVNVSLAPLSDLIVTSVNAPVSASPGDEITVTWTIMNVGANLAKGLMRDAVFVSEDGQWDLSDPALGIKEQTIDLAPGMSKEFRTQLSLSQTYLLDLAGQIIEELPGVKPGDYRLIVRTDIRNNIRESDESNNVLASAGKLAVSIPSLTLGVPYNTTLGPSQERFFKVVVDSGLDLSVELLSDQADADNEMYVAFNRVPSPSEYDFGFSEPFQPNQKVTVPSTHAGDYYISLLNKDESRATQSITVKVTALPFSISSVVPNAGGQGGQLTCRIRGAGFEKNLKVFLESPSHDTLLAELDSVLDRTEAIVRFSALPTSLGLYMLKALDKQGSVAISSVPFTVEEYKAYAPTLWVDEPAEFRRGSRAYRRVFIQNDGNVDIPVLRYRAYVPGDGALAHVQLIDKKGFISRADLVRQYDTTDQVPASIDRGNLRIIELIAPDVPPGAVVEATFSVVVEAHVWLPDVGTIHTVAAMSEQGFVSEVSVVADHLLSAWVDGGIFTLDDAIANHDIFAAAMLGIYERSGILSATSLGSPSSPFPLTRIPTAPTKQVENKTSLNSVEGDCDWLTREVYFPAAGCAATAVDCALPELTVLGCLHGFSNGATTTIGQVKDCLIGMGAGAVADALTCGIGIATNCYSPILAAAAGVSNPDFGVVACYGLANAIVCYYQYKICPPVNNSSDPNDISGPVGFGDEKWVNEVNPLAYTIQFENDSLKASAPAREITITLKLDSDLDFKSFRLGSFNFAGQTFDIPANTALYSKRLDVRDKLGIYVDVVAGVNLGKGEASWTFRSIDPLTGSTPSDPLAGLLPVNDSIGRGQGFVSYTIKPKTSVQSGDSVTAQASIVFDVNEPVVTPEIFNTIDPVIPASAVEALPVFTTTKQFSLHWSGTDSLPGSGVRDYSLYVAENDGPYKLLASGLTEKSFMFEGEFGKKYSFYTIAYDNVGNAEAAPSAADATTTLASALCGDFNGSGEITIVQVVYLINYIFLGGPAPIDARGGNVNCDHGLNIADVVYMVNYIFAHGPAPCAGCPEK